MVLGAPPFYPQKGQESPQKALKGYQKALKATKKLQKAFQKAGSPGFARPALKMRFFSTEIDGFGHPSILSPKGPGKHQKAPNGYQKALKATKRLQKAHQKAGNPGFARPALKMRFFSTEIDGFGHPSILSTKGPGKHQKAANGYQKALKATKRL